MKSVRLTPGHDDRGGGGGRQGQVGVEAVWERHDVEVTVTVRVLTTRAYRLDIIKVV